VNDEDRSWVKEGASVVVYSKGSIGTPPRVILTSVKKVATQSFTVASPNEPRFKLDTLSARRETSSWSSYLRIVVPAHSDEGQQKLSEAKMRKLIANADSAYTAWRAFRRSENLDKLIKTLNSVSAFEAEQVRSLDDS
jgi:hypothetical protein